MAKEEKKNNASMPSRIVGGSLFGLGYCIKGLGEFTGFVAGFVGAVTVGLGAAAAVADGEAIFYTGAAIYKVVTFFTNGIGNAFEYAGNYFSGNPQNKTQKNDKHNLKKINLGHQGKNQQDIQQNQSKHQEEKQSEDKKKIDTDTKEIYDLERKKQQDDLNKQQKTLKETQKALTEAIINQNKYNVRQYTPFVKGRVPQGPGRT
jgi:hypothetical protein